MKKTLLSLSFLLFYSTYALATVENLIQDEVTSQNENTFDYSSILENEAPSTWESLKELFGINTLIDFFMPLPHGTIATVNGEVITLNELQFYADLEKSSQVDDAEVSLEGVMEDYSTYLLELIQQKLIAQEVEKLSLSVNYDVINKIQQNVENRYTENLDSGLLASEVHQRAWAEQLKNNLQKEALLRYFLSSLNVNYDEIIRFHLENDGFFQIPEQYIFTLVYSETETPLRKALNKKIKDIEKADEYNVSMQQATLDYDNIPPVWREEIVKLKIGQFSKLKKIENSYFYIILNDKTPKQTASQTEAFLEIESILLDAKLRKAYDNWLEKAILSADISIAPEFSQTSNINLGTINTLEVESN